MLRRSADSLGSLPPQAAHGAYRSRSVAVLSAVAGWTVAFLILAGWLLLLDGSAGRIAPVPTPAGPEAGADSTTHVAGQDEPPPLLQLDEKLAKVLAPPPATPPVRKAAAGDHRAVVAAIQLSAVDLAATDRASVPAPFPSAAREASKDTGLERPARLAAPPAVIAAKPTLPGIRKVGHPVLILARLIDPAGRPVAGRRVDWSIDRHGVGAIVQVDPGTVDGRAVEEAAPLFARSYTPDAELPVGGVRPVAHWPSAAVGSTWCVVNAQTPGDMLIVAATPDGTGGVRDAVERLHWTSAQVQFPKSQSVLAGSDAVLATVVTDERTGAPLAGYRVRYRLDPKAPVPTNVAGGPIEVLTDVDGTARLRVVPTRLLGGRVAVRVELFSSPGLEAATAVRLAESEVAVEWQSPQFSIELRGPESAAVGEWCTLAARCAVTGIARADQLHTVLRVPATVETGPEPHDRAPLAPGGTTERKFRLRSTTPGKSTVVLELRHGDDLCASRECAIEFASPVVTIEKALPKEWWAGRSASCAIQVTNRGSAPARQVRIVEEVPPGIRIDEAAGTLGTFQLAFDLGDLEPGQTKSARYTATALAPIRRQVVLTRASGSNFTAVDHTATLEVHGAAVLAASVTDRCDPVAVNGEAEYTVTVSNRGTQAADGVRIQLELAPAIEQVEVNRRMVHAPADGPVWSTTARLNPDAEVVYNVRFRAPRPGETRLTIRVMHPSLGPLGLVSQESTIVYQP